MEVHNNSQLQNPVAAFHALAGDGPRRGDGGARTMSSPPAMNFDKVVGESGAASPPSASTQNSIIRLYAFERQHAPTQRRKVQENDLEVMRQQVDLLLSLTEDLKLVAVGGETVTTFQGEEGAPVSGELRELAFISDLRRALLSSQALLGRSQRAIPQITALDSALSELKIQQDRGAIMDLRDPMLLKQARLQRDDFREKKADAFRLVIGKLNGLRNALINFLSPDAVNSRVATSSAGDVIDAEAAPGAKVGGHVVVPLEIGRTTQFTSDAVADPGDADPDDGQGDFDGLGFEGTFEINRVAIHVVTTDTLRDIAMKINFGEDVNGNGFLDTGEDRNNNGVLDLGEDLNRNGALDISEDVNFNKVLDAGEDTNQNGRLDFSEDFDFDYRLDGGTSEHGVVASILNNRLVLTARDNGANSIDLLDDDDVLLNIGVLKRDPVTEVLSLKYPVRPGNLLSFALDGDTVSAPGNTVDDAIEGVRLTFRRQSSQSVAIDVRDDVSPVVSELKNFADLFNGAIVLINEQLSLRNLLEREPDIQRTRIDLEESPVKAYELGDGEVAGIEDVGILATDRRRAGFLENQLSRARQALAGEAAAPPFAKVGEPPTVPNSIDTLGIRFADDGTLAVDDTSVEAAFLDDARKARSTVRKFSEDLLDRLDRAIGGTSGNLTMAAGLFEDPVFDAADLRDLIEASILHQALMPLLP